MPDSPGTGGSPPPVARLFKVLLKKPKGEEEGIFEGERFAGLLEETEWLYTTAKDHLPQKISPAEIFSDQYSTFRHMLYYLRFFVDSPADLSNFLPAVQENTTNKFIQQLCQGAVNRDRGSYLTVAELLNRISADNNSLKNLELRGTLVNKLKDKEALIKNENKITNNIKDQSNSESLRAELLDAFNLENKKTLLVDEWKDLFRLTPSFSPLKAALIRQAGVVAHSGCRKSSEIFEWFKPLNYDKNNCWLNGYFSLLLSARRPDDFLDHLNSEPKEIKKHGRQFLQLADYFQNRKAGSVLLQFITTGDGLGSKSKPSGGSGIFIRKLSRQLQEEHGWKQIVTIRLYSPDDPQQLLVPLSLKHPNHAVIQLPVPGLKLKFDEITAESNLEISFYIQRILNFIGLQPDVAHVRFNNRGSLAAARVCARYSIPLVCTLAPDPHAIFTDQNNKINSPQTNKDSRLLVDQVEIAEKLIERADILVGQGFNGGKRRYYKYFPSVTYCDKKREKFKIIPHGIQIDEYTAPASNTSRFLKKQLVEHSGPLTLNPSALDKPAIINIGKLSFLKGQHRLVTAWAESSYLEDYSLIVIGSNHNNLNREESEIIDKIKTCIQENNELKGSISLVPELRNDRIRRLLNGLAEQSKPNLNRTYVCSSYKEEAGLAVMEAMAAGLPVMAPCRGGIGDFIRHKENGFLINTENPRVLKNELEKIIFQIQNLSQQKYKNITEAAEQTIRSNFSIEKVAEKFNELYRKTGAEL